MKTDCVFCAKVADGSAEQLLFNAGVATFEPLDPVTPGHRLFITTQHYTDAVDAVRNDEEWCSAGYVLQAAAWWAAQYDVGPCNFITSRGAEATQTIFHYHVHLIPRREGDGLALPWTGQRKAYTPLAVPMTDEARIDAENDPRAQQVKRLQDLGPIVPEGIGLTRMNYAPDHWDYRRRCEDVGLALAEVRTKVEEWKRDEDPHGFWHERANLIALYNEVLRLRALTGEKGPTS